MTPYLVVAAVGAGSYLFRVSMLLLATRIGLPAVVERAAKAAVPVSFAALAAGALAPRPSGHPAEVVPLISAVIAVVAVRRTGSAHAALIVGLPTLWLLFALIGS